MKIVNKNTSQSVKNTPITDRVSRVPLPGWEDIEPPTNVDRLLHALIARVTHGISPASLALANLDWCIHLSTSPGKWNQLLLKAIRKQNRLLTYCVQASLDTSTPPCIEPLPQDRRFRDPAWQNWPFNIIQQNFLLHQQWWHNATTGIGGASPHHLQLTSFMARQLLDMVSPVNFPMTNPQVLQASAQEAGMNFLRGGLNFYHDWKNGFRDSCEADDCQFRLGIEVACSPGRVVLRNRLIELIQYLPKTPEVFAEPILIVPAWIMKYYILDLSQHNSLVNYLLERGHTVFMISWHNPDADDRDLGMDDYLQLGILDAVKAVQTIVPQRKIDAVGYCLGGTLLSIAAAFLAHNQSSPFSSLSLLAAQTDFSDAGELKLFIDDSQLDLLEDMMWFQGYLDATQMAGAFRLLRSNDLLWSRMVNDYLLGQRAPMSDLMAWNADTTRMPYRMHSEYLRRLFQNNDLFEGRYKVNGTSIALRDIRVPVFAVATETDHVSPWHSVYKIKLEIEQDMHFVLTSGGHNAGIVSEPGHRNRHYRSAHWPAGAGTVDPDEWYLNTPAKKGSWWPLWARWLGQDAHRCAPPALGAADQGYPVLDDAPGNYVRQA